MSKVFLDWTDFKALIDFKSNLRVIGGDVFDKLIIYDFESTVITDSGHADYNSSDYTDYNTNYKPYANKGAVQPKQSPFADAAGHKFRGKGVQQVLTFGQVNDIDISIPEFRRLNGVHWYIVNGACGDSAKFQVIDKDNVLGYGANTVLDEFATDWQIDCSKVAQTPVELNYKADIPAGVYIRIKYTSTGTVNPTVKVNLFLHKVP